MTMQTFNPNLEELAPRAAYLRGLQQRLGTNPFGSIYGQFQADQHTPFQNTFAFNQLLNPSPAGSQSENPFLAYSQANNLGGVRTQARGLFNQLAGPDWQQVPAAISQQFRQPDEGQASALRNLAMTALMSRISPLALGLLNIPSGGDLRDRFLAESGGDPNGNFIQYIRSQLGLGLI